MLSHNADAFGAPFCMCCDEDGKSQLYDFTRPKRGHYGQTTFYDLCARAHVAWWDALGLPEPEEWEFACPCCPARFSSKDGGRAKLEAIDADLAALGPTALTNRLRSHAKNHLAQQLRREPLLPFHHVVFDPMHGMHNEANALLDEAVHQHFMSCSKSPDPAVVEKGERVQAKVNQMWKDAHLPKFIQFGKDAQGEHSHALNGPAFKAVWRHPTLLMDTIKAMEPIYELLESRGAVPPLQASAVGEAADKGPSAASKTKARKNEKQPAKKRAKKKRGVDIRDVGQEQAEEGVCIKLSPRSAQLHTLSLIAPSYEKSSSGHNLCILL